MANMAEVAAKHLPIVSRGAQDRLKGKLAARENSDLVFALTGYVGSGASYVAGVLSEQAQTIGFVPSSIRLSDLLAESGGIERSHVATVAQIGDLQDEGDRLRQAHGASIVAGLGVRRIHQMRLTDEGSSHRVFILDSLKHPAEVDVLRAIYGNSFYLVGVICNEETRRARLEMKFKTPADRAGIEMLMRRDRAGEAKYGQHVHKTLHLADFFVANEAREGLAEQLDRFLLAVTGREVVRPTRDERGMHAAWTASLRSSCLSRQVGAAIVGPRGALLATGTNDPPAPGGGVYQDGHSPDHRCFKWTGEESLGFCRNDRKKQEIYAEIHAKMKELDLLDASVDVGRLANALMQTRIRDLIEFSRAVHAEMDALLELARKGGGIPDDTSLFCRTYPCHSCARHIVAAGIREVVYIEPYDKSLALELHADALREVTVRHRNDETGDKRVVFRLFSGVAPRRFAALFEKRRDLKDGTGAVLPAGHSPTHADPVLTGSFLELEKELAEDVSTALEGIDGAD